MLSPLKSREEIFLLDAVQRLGQIFHEFDVGHDERLDVEEVGAAFKALVLPCTDKDIDAVFCGIEPTKKVIDERGLARYAQICDLLCGLVAGTVSRTLTAPAERVKTELQLAHGPMSIRSIARKVMQDAGPRGFFQGNLANCVKVAPQSAMFFAFTDYFKLVLPTKGNPALSSTHSFLSGVCAGLCSQFIVYPLEPIKTCLTVAPPGRYRGIVDCGRQLFFDGGLRALYRGALPTLAGCIPYAGMQRLGYDKLQSIYTRYSKSDRPSALVGFGNGLVSSSLGMAVSYPLVVIRTHLQVQGTAPEHPVRYSGIQDCFRQLLAQEGARGLFKGITPNLAKSAPAAGINFMLYDQAKVVMARFRMHSMAC